MSVRLSDCGHGDLVAITWPHGSDYVDIDRELRGTEQLVQFCNTFGSVKKGRNVIGSSGAFVRLVDLETLEPNLRALHVIENVEVIDVVERHRAQAVSNDHGERDLDDPLKR